LAEEYDKSLEPLAEFLDRLEKATGESAINVAKKTIDEASTEVLDELKQTTPKKTGGLAASIVKKPRQKVDGKYGWDITYDGYAPDGQAYQVIANALNQGRTGGRGVKRRKKGKQVGRLIQKTEVAGFINRAESKLKGLDDRIKDKILDSLDINK